MNTVAIIDYGMCNLDSVARAVEDCGGTPVVTHQAIEIKNASRIILPGVGAFPAAMRRIRAASLDEVLTEQVLGKRVPFLGICLGMQLIATTGLEVEETPGLGWIDGVVRKLEPTQTDRRIPHIGWNEVLPVRDSAILCDTPSGTDFYFVHSYVLDPANQDDVVAVTPYGGGFTAAVERGNIFGLQFHPEKSQRSGFRVLRRFLSV